MSNIEMSNIEMLNTESALVKKDESTLSAIDYAQSAVDIFKEFKCFNCNNEFSRSRPPFRICEGKNASKMNGAKREAHFARMKGETGEADFEKFRACEDASGCIMCYDCVWSKTSKSGAPCGHSDSGDCVCCIKKYGEDPSRINRALAIPAPPAMSGVVSSLMCVTAKYEATLENEKDKERIETREKQILLKMQESTEHDFFPYKGPVSIEAIPSWQEWKRERENEETRVREEARMNEEAAREAAEREAVRAKERADRAERLRVREEKAREEAERGRQEAEAKWQELQRQMEETRREARQGRELEMHSEPVPQPVPHPAPQPVPQPLGSGIDFTCMDASEEAIATECEEREKARDEKKRRAKESRDKKKITNSGIMEWMAEYAEERKIDVSDDFIAARDKKNPPSDKATLDFAWGIMGASDAASITDMHGAALRRVGGLFYKHLVAQVRAEQPDIAKADLKKVIFSKMSAIPAAHNDEESRYVKEKFEWDNLSDIYRQLFDY